MSDYLRFLAVGDIHYESIQTYFPENHLTLVSNILRNIWNYAIEENVKYIFLLGDIFHTPYPDDNSKKAFLDTLSRKLNYYIILGNHDIATSESNSLILLKYFMEDYGIIDNVKFFFEPTNIEVENVRFNLLPYPHKKATCKEKSICLGHFETKGSLMDNGKEFKEGVELDTENIWILGHLHRRQGLLYPGSVCQTRFGEPVNKYFFDCVFNKKSQVIEIEAKHINTGYKLIDLTIDNMNDSNFNKLEKGNCYRIYANKHLNLNEITERCKDYNIYKIIGCENSSLSKSKDSIGLEDTEVIIDEMQFLEKWLYDKNNCDLSDAQVKKALNIVNEIKDSINV